MAGNKIYLQVDFQSQNANANITTLNQNIKGIGTAAQQASSQASSALKGVSVTVEQVSHSMRNLVAAFGGLSFAAIAKGALETALAFETNRLALNALTGSVERGTALFQELQKVAQTTPATFKELLEGSKRLLSMGFAADEVTDKLRIMSLTVSGMGGGVEKLNSLIDAFGQIRAAGHLTGEELRQLRQIPIPALEILTKAFGVTTAVMQKAISDGIVPADQAIRALTEGMRANAKQMEQSLKGSATVALSNFQDAWDQFADSVIRNYLPALTDFINNKLVPGLKDLTTWWERNRKDIEGMVSAIADLAPAVAALVATAVFYKLGLQIESAAVAMRAFNLAAAANPWGLLAAGVGLAVVEAYKFNQQMKEIVEQKLELQKGADIRQQLISGKTVEDLVKAKVAIEDIKKAVGDLDLSGISKAANLGLVVKGYEGLTQKRGAEAPSAPYEFGVNAEKAAKKAAEQMEKAQSALDRARAKEEGSIFGLRDKYAALFRDVKGNAAATSLAIQAMGIELARNQEALRKKNRDDVEKYLQEIEKLFDLERQRQADLYKDHLKFQEDTIDIGRRAILSRFEFEETVANAQRDQQLAQLDVTHRETLAQEIEYQRQKAAIEIAGLEKTQEIRLDLEDKAFQHELALIQATQAAKLSVAKTDLERKQITQDELDRVEALTTASAERIRQIVLSTTFETQKIRLEAEKATNNAIYEEQKKIYDKLKDSVSRIFDALVTKSSSVWAAIANSFKTAILGAIKEIVTSRAAAALMRLFGYGDVSFGGGMRGLGGQQPIFGGGGGGGLGGVFRAVTGLGAARQAFGTPGAPGGTPGFTGPVGAGPNYSPISGGAGGLGGYSPAASPAGSVSQMAGVGGGFKSLLGLGNLGAFGGGAAGAAGALATSPAAGVAGALLAAQGVKRGGVGGLAMTTAGGFFAGAASGMMIGALLGAGAGPLGAAIGAFVGTVVGAIIGTIRLFTKTADQKLRSKIKQVYGVDLADAKVRAQILEIAKQKYGGNLDMTVRSPEVQELVRLYALATGATPGGMPRPLYPVTFAQSGSSLALQPVYSSGQIVANPYSGITTSQYAQGVYVQLNPQQANDLFEGRVVNVVNQNPESVAGANSAAIRSGTARTAQRGALMEPLTVMR
jgi:tape measure domain-containing protein